MILYGKPVAEKILQQVEDEVKQLGRRLRLTIVSAKDFDQASKKYMDNKKKACTAHGIDVDMLEIEWKGCTKGEFLNKLRMACTILSNNTNVDGFLVQLPLPFNISEKEFVSKIDPLKDVDGFTSENVGKLFDGELDEALLPCTPSGIMEIFKYYNIDLEGKDVVIINRSNIVGKPMLHLLLQKNATVTICHSKTKDLKDKIRKADIVITGVGRTDFLDCLDFKRGATVVDVSINFKDGKLCGDVNKADYHLYEGKENIDITPVPQGVGATTVAMVAHNVLKAYKLQNERRC